MVEVYGPHDESTCPSFSPISSSSHFLAAFTQRDSFIRTILLRTILRQYEPSSLGCTTVTSFESSSYRISACSTTSLALSDAHSAPSSKTLHTDSRPESITATLRPRSSSFETTMPSGASVVGSYSITMPSCTPSTAPSAMCHQQTVLASHSSSSLRVPPRFSM